MLPAITVTRTRFIGLVIFQVNGGLFRLSLSAGRIVMEKQEMTPLKAAAVATYPTNYLFTPQTLQMPSDMDWATLFLSDPEQAPPYEIPNASMTLATAKKSRGSKQR
ncbi:hypothetical protein POM88_032896 [Heracleum sosnowskyi]|uniref:Uncharacterized protein n=1 Tax=Heracleum sosnowskyi TaxID=360622 RepID=A0AAD8I129_9APIA|nr:hypothetical protein POM88_032893 [Heracleum sosnowskyi]KAK1376703.1 hypothetical protein POM88_032896 [Heracleum sosnowskyi]